MSAGAERIDGAGVVSDGSAAELVGAGAARGIPSGVVVMAGDGGILDDGQSHGGGSTSSPRRHRIPQDVDPRFGGPLWRAVLLFWVGAQALSIVVWLEATLGNGGGLGNASESHAWLVPVATFAGGLIAFVIARASGLVAQDRRVLYSAWMAPAAVAGLFLAQLGFSGEPWTNYSLAVGSVMFPSYLVTVAVLARHQPASEGLGGN
jgi:hypothetical protein